MAGRSGSRGGGERVLESRHLVGLFLGVVMLCAVFFTLGYVMGRTQFAPVNANSPHDGINPIAPATNPPPQTHPDPNANSVDTKWSFEDKSNVLQPRPSPKLVTPAPSKSTKPVASTKPAPPISTAEARELRKYAPPKIKNGAILVQLAALSKESDAISMVDELQRKRFQSFVVTTPADSLYHVQVGPYPDVASAEKAKAALIDAGFKAIIVKR